MSRPSTTRTIKLRGVRVHNLRSVDVDLPHRKLIVLCGLSGSGKSSLALDTLYAEGQRRYIESFSAYTRQFLEQLERPDADHIEGIPPAIAVGRTGPSRSSRSTVGTATETLDYLRLLLARIGRVFCQGCNQEVRRDSPQTAADQLAALPEGTRYLICYPLHVEAGQAESTAGDLREDGFTRVVIGETIVQLDETGKADDIASGEWQVVIDRLSAGKANPSRVRESLETAFTRGQGQAAAFVEAAESDETVAGNGVMTIDGRRCQRLGWSKQLRCEACGLEYPTPEPRLFSFNSPLGACPLCEGFGNTNDIDMELVVPDPTKSLNEGAVAPWTTPAYAHELEELQALADDYGVPLDVPYAQLDENSLRLIQEGVPVRKFGGLSGFFKWLERRKYKMHIRVFLSRWRSYRICRECGGARLRPEVLATRIGGKNLAEICALKIRDAAAFFREIQLTDWQQSVARTMLQQVRARLGFLEDVGLGYLTLDRSLRTVSGGEAQRVALTSTLGSSLVNMLYVLDEPTVGLHPRDTLRLLQAAQRLRDRGNTVVVVEHEEAFIRAADQVIEIGPEAGDHGGRVTFQGTPEELQASVGNLTGDYLAAVAAFPRPVGVASQIMVGFA